MRVGVTPAAVWAAPWLTRAASSEDRRSISTLCPSPVAVRCVSAARILTDAKRPARTSTSATPTFCGSPSGGPEVILKDLLNPVIEQYTSPGELTANAS